MTTEEMREVMREFIAGKPIEFRTKERGSEWENCPNPTPAWNWNWHEYRVKPEANKVPLEASDFDEGDWMVMDPTGTRARVFCYDNDGIYLGSGCSPSYESLMADGWKWKSVGAPCWMDCSKKASQ